MSRGNAELVISCDNYSDATRGFHGIHVSIKIPDWFLYGLYKYMDFNHEFYCCQNVDFGFLHGVFLSFRCDFVHFRCDNLVLDGFHDSHYFFNSSLC